MRVIFTSAKNILTYKIKLLLLIIYLGIPLNHVEYRLEC